MTRFQFSEETIAEAAKTGKTPSSVAGTRLAQRVSAKASDAGRPDHTILEHISPTALAASFNLLLSVYKELVPALEDHVKQYGLDEQRLGDVATTIIGIYATCAHHVSLRQLQNFMEGDESQE